MKGSFSEFLVLTHPLQKACTAPCGINANELKHSLRKQNLYVNTYGRSHVKATDGERAEMVKKLFDLRPKAIEKTLKLRQPMYLETAAYGHMGRQNEVVKKTFESRYHEKKTVDVELFTWEKLDRVEDIKKTFGL